MAYVGKGGKCSKKTKNRHRRIQLTFLSALEAVDPDTVDELSASSSPSVSVEDSLSAPAEVGGTPTSLCILWNIPSLAK